MVEMTKSGAATVPSFDLPISTYASPESRDHAVQQFRSPRTNLTGIEAARKGVDDRFYGPKIEWLSRLHPCAATKSVMGGVAAETFVPRDGIAPENRRRVLIPEATRAHKLAVKFLLDNLER